MPTQCPKSSECSRRPRHPGRCDHRRQGVAPFKGQLLAAKPRLLPILETGKGTQLAAAKRVTPRKRKLADSAMRLDNFLRTLTALYPVDEVSPGIVVSCIRRGEDRVFYASIVRYENPHYDVYSTGTEALRSVRKQVLFKAESPVGFIQAVDCAIDQWFDCMSKDLKGVCL